MIRSLTGYGAGRLDGAEAPLRGRSEPFLIVKKVRDPHRLKRELIGICSDAIDLLETVGEYAIKAGSGEVEGRRLALWGAGTFLFLIGCGWFGWAVLG